MRINLLISITSIILIGAIACQKEEAVPVQLNKVVVDITSPTADQVVHQGEKLNIVATISYITQMHGYIIKIVNEETGELYYETEGHAHGDAISVNEEWTDNIATKEKLQLQLTAIVDHELNETQKNVAFVSQP